MKKKLKLWLIALPSIFIVAMFLVSCMASRPDNLGLVDGKLAPCPSSPNCVCSFEKESDEKHYIQPMSYSSKDEEVLPRIKEVLNATSRTEIITETENYLHVESTSLIFRFVDDLEVFVDSKNKKIHFRSASRVGHSDLGANRKRVEALKQKLKGI